MPELPEVETTVRFLRKARPPILGAGFVDLWSDFKKIVKKPKNFQQFKKEIQGKKILKIRRRAKNIIFELSSGYSLLIHQKLTGHLLYAKWEKDRVNDYIHLKFFLNNGKILALSDLRKFAKVELWKSPDLEKELRSLGPEPLEKNFIFKKFKEALKGRRGKIKQILMNQEIIAGIGNIYSDEALWRAKIHPFKEPSKLSEAELKKLYQSLKEVLKKSIKLHGESISDYRDPSGSRGNFDRIRMVYRREGEKCSRCGRKIKRLKMAGRSARFCSLCQKL
jgi:formamidopyrimidine-DNA glycosylase